MARRANEGRLRALAETIAARPGLTAEDGKGRLAHFESVTGEPEPDGIPSAPSAGQARTWVFWAFGYWLLAGLIEVVFSRL